MCAFYATPFAPLSGASLRYALSVTSELSSDLQRARIGLCADCTHARRIESARGSEFYFCGLSATDENFPKYPRLPVLQCSGYAAKSSGTRSG
jgi:hypothetical protein